MGNTNTKKRLENAPVVVIVGGGFAGIQAAKALDSVSNVLVIDRKNYFFHNVAALRACTVDGFVNNILVPYDKLLKFGHVVQAEVTEISPLGHVMVFGRDEPIKYDYLIIATGTAYAFPCKIAEPNISQVPARYEGIHSEILKADHIVIIGGGPVGVEMLGEITEAFPQKKITLVHSREELCPGPTLAQFKAKLLTTVKLLPNVTLLLGHRVIFDEEMQGKSMSYLVGKRTIRTDKGFSFETDLVLFCNGSKVNNKSFRTLFAQHIDESGRLKVNGKLQVEGYKNIFAIGDCANVPEVKMAYYGGLQGQAAAKNIKEMINGASTLKVYQPSPTAMMVPVGSTKGVSQLPIGSGMVVGDFMTSMIKGKGLFVAQTCKDLNQAVPKDIAQIDTEKTANEADVSHIAKAMQMSEEDMRQLKKGLGASAENVDFT